MDLDDVRLHLGNRATLNSRRNKPLYAPLLELLLVSLAWLSLSTYFTFYYELLRSVNVSITSKQ